MNSNALSRAIESAVPHNHYSEDEAVKRGLIRIVLGQLPKDPTEAGYVSTTQGPLQEYVLQAEYNR
jgi:hypothetical protein